MGENESELKNWQEDECFIDDLCWINVLLLICDKKRKIELEYERKKISGSMVFQISYLIHKGFELNDSESNGENTVQK